VPVPPADAIGWYDAHASELSGRYEALNSDVLLSWLAGLLPDVPAVVFDIGAGTGRDAAGLAARGFEVIAVEPSATMRAEGTQLHPNSRIKWVDDRLPALQATLRLGIAADAVLLSAVWMHVPPGDRPRAFRKIVSLLKSGGLLAITLRHGPAEPERAMHTVSLEEMERLARDHGLAVVRVRHGEDRLGRSDVSWTQVALRLPDDGTDALPLLRHVILHDGKSSTYKLGLLRALCRAADGAAGLASDGSEDHVALPLGLVALNWLRLYLPLLKADLPQSPANVRGGEKLGFARNGLRTLLTSASPFDLRVGARFGRDTAGAVHAALCEAAETITRMPATYMTYPGGGRVLPVEKWNPRAPGDQLTLDAGYLRSFGTMRVPRTLWRALQRFAVWIEPSLIAEWTRLMRVYADSQGRRLDGGCIGAAMTWSDPVRDVSRPREIALRIMALDEPLHCIWSGRRLEPGTLDIDHCFPWMAWPCGDLWNLLPAHRQVNQHQKRDRLPSEDVLRRSRDAILDWWSAGYLTATDPVLPLRFGEEARASLPALDSTSGLPAADDVFTAMTLQRLRLRQDQQVPEWTGP
jgi:SAM-dependent methyltransferase